ncbi:MAG: plastocyanin/azurin family copper-binding protein [Nitrososphaeraceae archaeon]
MKNILLFVTITALLTTILGVPIGNQNAFAQEQVSIAPGSSNPSASQFYVPPQITVSSGSTVTWTNDDATIHTVTEGSPQGGGAGVTPAFDSGIIAPTAIWENTFDTAGEFNYYCSLHPFMTGKVTVT